MPSDRCLLTVATYGYLPKALVLAHSFLARNPASDVLVLVVDMSHEQVHASDWGLPPAVRLLGFDDIESTELRMMHEYFDAFELCCAAKSFLVEHGLFEEGYDKVVLLDPDIACYAPFDEVWAALEDAGVVLTPHASSPTPEDGWLPDDRELVTAGFINAGFWAARKSDELKGCLNWIQRKVADYGFFMPEQNLYADQIWMSCLPWFFPQITRVSRQRGLNVAYWNLYERKLSERDGQWLADGEKLVFFHFSGYDDENPASLTRYSNRPLDVTTSAIVRKLVGEYARDLAIAAEKLPKLEPDLPCSERPVRERLWAYEGVRGEKPKFDTDLGSGSSLVERSAFVRRVRDMVKRRRGRSDSGN